MLREPLLAHRPQSIRVDATWHAQSGNKTSCDQYDHRDEGEQHTVTVDATTGDVFGV